MARCNHSTVRQALFPSMNGREGGKSEGRPYYNIWGCYICPDCNRPVEVSSNTSFDPAGCIPSVKVANWSMAGVGNYWREWNGSTFMQRGEATHA